MEVSCVAFALTGFVVNPVVVLVAVYALSRIASCTANGALDAGVLVLSVVADAFALICQFVVFPEIGSITSLAYRERLTF